MDSTKSLNEILMKLLGVATDLSRYQHASEARSGLEDLALAVQGESDASGEGLIGIARRLLEESEVRSRYVSGIASSDHCWPIVLDLYIHAATNQKVSVTDACIAARAPNTTALRWLNELVEHGIVERAPDAEDGRRSNVTLSAQTFASVSRYLARAAGIEALIMRADSPPSEQAIRLR